MENSIGRTTSHNHRILRPCKSQVFPTRTETQPQTIQMEHGTFKLQYQTGTQTRKEYGIIRCSFPTRRPRGTENRKYEYDTPTRQSIHQSIRYGIRNSAQGCSKGPI